jgi:hypothetical protein
MLHEMFHLHTNVTDSKWIYDKQWTIQLIRMMSRRRLQRSSVASNIQFINGRT